MAKPMSWPKWTEQYEDIQENSALYKKITRADRSWNWLGHRGLSLVSTARNLFRTFRKVTR